MAIPAYSDIFLPLLQWLYEQNDPVSLQQTRTFLEQHFSLTDEEKEARLKSGSYILYNRLGWARTYLKKAELIDSPNRGKLALTALGRKQIPFLKDENDLDHFLAQSESYQNFIRPKQDVSDDETAVSLLEGNTATPAELLEDQITLLNQSVVDELIDTLKGITPAFFEQIVVDVLVAMGYGGSHQDAAKAIGRSGDGGIDGIISEDRLGLDKIYIQAKRWENKVDRPEIQKFIGALTDQNARKGVFITTSSFTDGAHQSANKSGLVLIDGVRLAELMIEFRVGISVAGTYHVFRIDQDYFDEE